GFARSRLARLNVTTGAVDPSWDSGTLPIAEPVSLAKSSTHLYWGGDFTHTIIARHALANGAMDATWRPAFTDFRTLSQFGHMAGYGGATSLDGSAVFFPTGAATPREGLIAFSTAAFTPTIR